MRKQSGFKPPEDAQRLLKDPDKARSYWRGVGQVEDWLNEKPKGIRGRKPCPSR